MSSLRSLAFVATAAMLSMAAAMIARPVDSTHLHSRPLSLPLAGSEGRFAEGRLLLTGNPSRFAARPALLPPHIVEAQPAINTDDVAERVQSIVPAELQGYFDMYLYVSKAAAGPWAQHMVVFHKTQDGRLAYQDDFPVSTGRERQEKYFTSTPNGFFELDPNRFDRVHYSHRWHNAPMPWAMFLNYVIRGHLTGVAVHSAVGHEGDLGHRASGGCIRVPPDKAQLLFQRIQETEAGRVPVIAMDETEMTTDKSGRLLRGVDGAPLFANGYKVLLIIEDYPGAPVAVATLS